jgi:hypothetical protein
LFILNNVELGGSLSESFCLAPSVEDVVVHLIIVVLGCHHLNAWSACVGWDVDTSMFLRTVTSPETLNGSNRREPGLERCLCVLEVLTIAG